MMLRFAILMLFLLFSVSSFAEESGPFVQLNISSGTVDSNYSSTLFESDESQTYSESSGGIGGGFGYLFKSNVSIDVEFSRLGSVDFFGAFDHYRLTHIDVSLGYKFRWKKLYFRPKVGRAKWRLTAKEGMFLNPGVEQVKKIADNDNLWGIAIGYARPRVDIFLSYKNIDTYFGGYNLSSIGYIVNF